MFVAARIQITTICTINTVGRAILTGKTINLETISTATVLMEVARFIIQITDWDVL
jgi:hypothetical protein